jgi:branched-chain amino acid transport system ATP-binding protein
VTGLRVHNVGVRFGGLVALDGVTFEAPPASVVGIIGPNGAGKTTLFNVISGFVKPTQGELTWEGRPLRPRPDRLVASGMARTLQGVGLFTRLTALENVMVGATTHRKAGFASALLGLPRSDRDEARLRAEALDWLDRLGAADVSNRVAGTLAFPMQ